MYGYSRNILLLSIVISLITATCLYVALQTLLVRPIRRITQQVTEFAEDPENPVTGVSPTTRSDEIGIAQSVLVEMQNDVRNSLRQRRQLAALGSAVSKINHDLRGILSTAVLVSDRLAGLDDPRVKAMRRRTCRRPASTTGYPPTSSSRPTATSFIACSPILPATPSKPAPARSRSRMIAPAPTPRW